MTTKPHTVRSFDAEVERVAAAITEMGSLVRDQFSRFLWSLDGPNEVTAGQIVVNDRRLDELMVVIEQEVARIIALRQPVAADLRQLMCYFSCAGDLERMGDHVKNAARRLVDIWGAGPATADAGVSELARELKPSLDRLVMAIETHDAGLAKRVWHADDAIDALYDRVAADLAEGLAAHPQDANVRVHWLFIAKSLERIGDHVTNVAESIVYWDTGERLAGHGE